MPGIILCARDEEIKGQSLSSGNQSLSRLGDRNVSS